MIGFFTIFFLFIGRIVNQGPSVVVVEDRNGYIFGGFAPANWELGPKFFGDDSSFLFTLAPRMRVFPSTGYNKHFQYLNLHQQTLPNGLVSNLFPGALYKIVILYIFYYKIFLILFL